MSFRKRASWIPVVIASGLASIVAYQFVGSPWHVSLGAIAGVALAAIHRPGQAAERVHAMTTTVAIILAAAVATYFTAIRN